MCSAPRARMFWPKGNQHHNFKYCCGADAAADSSPTVVVAVTAGWNGYCCNNTIKQFRVKFVNSI